MTVGQQIKAIREKADLTQKEFSKKINIHPISLSRIENDRALPRATTVEKIIDKFGNIEVQAELVKSFMIETGKKKINLFSDLLIEIAEEIDLDLSKLKSKDILDIYELVEIIIKNRLKKLDKESNSND